MANILKRKAANGTVTYLARVRLRGAPPRSETFTRKTDAKQWAQKIEAAIREGRHFPERDAQRRTLADAIDRYIPTLEGRLRHPTKRAAEVRWWRDRLGDYPLAQLTPAVIREVRDELKQTPTASGARSAASCNRYLAALRHLLSDAVREWEWLHDNPARKVRALREPRGRVRCLDDDERRALLAACEPTPDLYTLVVLALHTGARQGELLGLRWPDVDLNRSPPRVVFNDTKNGERRAAPLSERAVALLRERQRVRHVDTDLLFAGQRDPHRPRFPRHAWEAALRAAEVENFTFHDLRHTFASYLAQNGATLMQIAEALGHKTLAMVRRYSHLTEGNTAAAVESMAARFLDEDGATRPSLPP